MSDYAGQPCYWCANAIPADSLAEGQFCSEECAQDYAADLEEDPL